MLNDHTCIAARITIAMFFLTS